MSRKAVVFIIALAGMVTFCSCGPTDEISVRPGDDVIWPVTSAVDEVLTEAFSETEDVQAVTEVSVSVTEPETAPVTEAETSEAEKKGSSDNKNESGSGNSSSENKPSDNSSGDSSSGGNDSGNSNSGGQNNSSPGNESPKQEESPSPEPEPEPSQEPEREFAPAPVVNNAELKYADGVLIVNKSYPVPQDYEPSGLVTAYGTRGEYLLPETNEAFKQMCIDAANEGLNLWCASGYRSVSTQDRIYNSYVARDGKAAADTYSARPGHSEHHTGLCFDLNTIDSSFAYTAEGKWVAENCWKYGLIIRYPQSKEDITGYKYEPWHLRYVGTDLAKTLYESGLCMEEYFGLTSCYSE
ncbi:M15 family metallopeptidase [Ruminococcus sp. HUN007]|uniref:M15 family metallopeptidase n=1 Tax=Ruminococcus sp. HUN007 TaxID=1514668 RepID=UPI000678B02E|nr:M15 family metallopeptidase [Ruminococcus sp. HUN007]